jgi:hypothetical protein
MSDPALSRGAPAIAAVAAIALAAFGVFRGTYAAGGSDSSCYALMADAFASARLQPASELALQVPWPDATGAFAPGGFLPSPTTRGASVPVCAPGFSLLLAPLMIVGGRDALFLLTPLAGALLVWMTFLAGRALAGPPAGAMAAVLVAASAPVLYQVVQPMNDVATAALWMGTFWAAIRRRNGLAGVLCGLALLVRPNLLPLGAVTAAFVLFAGPDAVRFFAGCLPFAAAVLFLNTALYGSPMRTGYGSPARLFSLSHAGINVSRYSQWVIETATVFPLLAVAAPFLVRPGKRTDVLFACALVVANFGIYFVYTPFEDWSYVRFVLVGIALMIVLASAATIEVLNRMSWTSLPSSALRHMMIVALTAGVALYSVRAARDRYAFDLRFLEQRYRAAGLVVRDRLPAEAVIVSVWDSGAVRFHGRKEVLLWDALEPAALDGSLSWLAQNGRQPYLVLESWEEPLFRSRFSGYSETGKLDWPPRYEVDRKVRIYDPRDRARFLAGERIDTEFVWPLND